MIPSTSSAEALIERVAGLFAGLPEVQAVALGGSRVGAASDQASDIDLYVFTRREISLAARAGLVEAAGGASTANLGLTCWGPGDEWYAADSGSEVDIVYFDAAWFSERLDRLWRLHQASLGYTTCLWYTLRHSRSLHDPFGWYAALQEQSRQDYPEPRRQNIIALNHPVLRQVIPAYYHQIEKAVRRGDLVSVNHRLAALLASYFDLLFAFNRLLHPGEKRLAAFAQAECRLLPAHFSRDLTAVLFAAASDGEQLLDKLTNLLDALDELLDMR